MTARGIDVSHHQGAIDFGKVKASGIGFAVVKATEGVGFTDPLFAAYRRQARAAGLIVGIYHFARAGDAAAEAAYFLRVVGALQPGEFLVLDWEVPATDPPGWCKAWLDAVHAATGVKPLIYLNQSAMRGWNWTDGVVRGDYGLWLAVYDNSTAQPAVSQWAAAAMKQYSDRGTVPGISGGVDLDVFYGTAEQLLAYCKAPDPAPEPLPAPTPDSEDDDMPQVITGYVEAGGDVCLSIPPVLGGAANWGQAWLTINADRFGRGSAAERVTCRVGIQGTNADLTHGYRPAFGPAMDFSFAVGDRPNVALAKDDVGLVISATGDTGIGYCVEYARA